MTRGITWPLFAAIALCALGAIVALSFLKASPAYTLARRQKTSLFVFPSAATLAFCGILIWVAIATVQISAGFYFQDRLDLDSDAAAGMLSLALTLVGTAMFAVQFLQDRMLRFAPRILILAGAAWWIVGLLPKGDKLPLWDSYFLFLVGVV